MGKYSCLKFQRIWISHDYGIILPVLMDYFAMCMLDEIYAIARAHKAEKLWVFGFCACKEDVCHG